MFLHVFTFNSFAENSYVLGADGQDRCVVVDPGCSDAEERETLFGFLEHRALTPEAILLTHAHPDHIYGVKTLQDRFGGIPAYLHPADRALFSLMQRFSSIFHTPEADCGFAARDLADGMTLHCAGLTLEVIATPGHSPGSVCFYEKEEGLLLTGDSLFAGTIGRTDLPGGDYDDLIRSVMERLVFLPGETRILPGHGPETNIARERTGNPFLEPWGEKEEPFDPDLPGIEIHM